MPLAGVHPARSVTPPGGYKVVTDPRPIVVVGGGLAGLVAACSLRASGEHVVVLEAGARAGGRVQTEAAGPWLTESGPHLFSGMPAECLTLFEELGLERQGPAPDTERRYLIQAGRLVPVPGSTSEMLSTPLLRARGRLRLLREPFIPRSDADRESVAGFVRRRMGEEFSRSFVEPVVAAAYAGDPSALLAKYAFAEAVRHEARAGSILKGRMRASRAARREGRRAVAAWTCRTGCGALPARLAAALGDLLRLDAEVVEVARSGSGWRVRQRDGREHLARGVVIATGAHALGRGLIAGLPDALSLADLAAMPQAPTVSLSLGFRRADVGHPLDGHGIVGPADGSAGFRSCVFVSTLFPERSPAGHVLLTVQVGRIGDADLFARSTDDLTARALASLGGLLGITGEPCFVARSAGSTWIPQPLAGHERYLTRADAVEAAYPGLVFCGRWRDGVTEGAVARGGGEAALRVRACLTQSETSRTGV